MLAARWETSDHDGEPFPGLDADLTLTPAGPGAAPLEMVSVYRADPGEDGHCTAAKPFGGFLDRIAETITRAGAAAGLGPARDPGPGKAGCSALSCGAGGPRQ